MTADDVIETFVGTVISVVFVIVGLRILFPEIGAPLVDLIPAFVEVAVYVFVGVFIAALLWQMAND